MPNAELIPQWLIDYARARDAGIVVTDYPLARNKRVHIAWLPFNDAQLESTELDELLTWLSEAQVPKAVFVAGRRKRPVSYYVSRLAPVHWTLRLDEEP